MTSASSGAFLFKGIKNSRQEFFRNPNTAIGYSDYNLILIVLVRSRGNHYTTFLGELNGVTNDIVNDLIEHRIVGQAKHPGEIYLHRESKSLGTRQLFQRSDTLANQLVNVHYF